MPMTDLYDKIISQKGGFEKLIAKIPGFRGYQEMQARRTADTMLRQYLGDRLEQAVSRFTRLENDILDGGKGLRYMTRTREVKSKLQAYTDIINTANPKYSGMWASIKIDEAALERIYSFDEAQVRYIDELERKIDALSDALKSDDFSQELESVFDTAVEAIDAFALRDNEILQLDSQLGGREARASVPSDPSSETWHARPDDSDAESASLDDLNSSKD
jgi:hypothetical protein